MMRILSEKRIIMDYAGKHIVFIVENLSVPFDRRVWREAKSLHSAGYKVSVICPVGYSQDREYFSNHDGINIYRYNLPYVQNTRSGYIKEYLRAFIATLFIMIKINYKNKIDALHVANPPEIFFPLGWLGKIFGFKFIFDHHDLSPESYLYKFNKSHTDKMYRFLLLMEKLTYKTSSFVFATNESLKKIAVGRTNYSESRTAIVRNGPDKNFQPVSPKPEIKKNRKYLAAYIGVMGQTDGVDIIIRAVNYIVNEAGIKDIQFVLIGFGDEYQNHVSLKEELGLSDYIDMPGRLPDRDVIEILSTADVCLAPDPANGLNEFHTMNKIMDYMRVGKPIVSFDLHETRYTAAESAVYIKDNNIYDFANSIIDLCSDREKRLRMGKIGRERVKNFTWEISESVLLEQYSKLWR